MEINQDDPKLIPFYQKMSALKLVLMTHTAKEKSFSRAEEELGDPDKLRLPLGLGVTVIAAHAAAAETYRGERGRDRLARLMRQYPNLYTDMVGAKLPLIDSFAVIMVDVISKHLPKRGLAEPDGCNSEPYHAGSAGDWP
jgi:hypothetical protein